MAELGSADFEVRVAAANALESLGAPALEALRKGQQSDDPEVRMRSAQLVKKLETRLAGATLLTAKRVHLVYKDKPLSEALADFNKQSGYSITLFDPQNTLKDRRVTLDTGDVTFWQALDKFCEAASLTETSGAAQGFGVNVGPRPIRRPLQPVPVQPQAQPVPVQPQALPPQGAQLNVKPAEARPAQPKEVEGKPAQPKDVEVKPAQAKEVEGKPALPPQGARQLQPAQPQVVVQAQVVQVVQIQGPQAQPVPVQVQIQGQAVPLQVQIQPGFQVVPNGPVNPNQPEQGITLVDARGRVQTLPTDASHAVRVRALDRNDIVGEPREKEILLALQVTPEPKLHWQFLSGVRITKAVDDNGQNLTTANPADPEVDPNLNPGLPRVRNPRIIRQLPMENVLPVRLKAGAQPSKTLKELQGIVTAQVLTDPQAVITVDKVLEAAGKTFKGGEGGVLRVLEVKKQADDQVEVRFEFEAPRMVLGAAVVPATTPAVGNAPIQPALRRGAVPEAVPAPTPGGPGAVPPPAVAAQVFTLLDDKGNPLPLLNQNMTSRNDPRGTVAVYRLVFRSATREPARLVCMGQHSVTLEIPFTLADVTIP